MSLSECSESYFSVNINLGERKESNNLQVHMYIVWTKMTEVNLDFFQFHNNIVKYVLQSFSSVTVHLEGEVYQVYILHLMNIFSFLQETISISEHNYWIPWCYRRAHSESKLGFSAISWNLFLSCNTIYTNHSYTSLQVDNKIFIYFIFFLFSI